MAPASQPKRKPKENQYLFNLGVRGRKTGLTLPDTGIRDENGLEPMDHLFSSPEKPKAQSVKKTNGNGKNANQTISDEEDMDIEDGTGPDLTAVLTERRAGSVRLPPRSNSPKKTFLQSPARRLPSIGPSSSPVRNSIVIPRAASALAPVRRKLDFSHNSLPEEEEDDSISSIQPKRASAPPSKKGTGKLTAAQTLAPPRISFSPANGVGDDSAQYDDSDMALLNVDDGEDEPEIEEQEQASELELEPEPESEPEPEPEPQPAKKKQGRPKKTQAPVPEPEPEGVQAGSKRGRSKKAAVAAITEEGEEPEVEGPPAKRTRRSLEGAEAAKKKGPKPKKAPVIEEEPETPPEEEPEPALKPMKSKVSRSKSAPSAPAASRAKSTKSKLATINETDSPQVHRGPPMPRRNNGLFILRRETPSGEGTGFKQTRSGRNSIKPLAYWKNEHVEYDEDAVEDHWGKFLVPKIKEVVRADEVQQPKTKARSKSRKPSGKGKKRAESESEDEDELEPWETEPGQFNGNIREWNIEEGADSKVTEREEEIALSSAAIITRDIAGASFRFAKTLTLPFFGSGMVDLPPGAIKRPKNSRKMQMAFFVFYGKVKVIVNDSEFRISKGGMWQVPRGNFYSIENDYDKPARIFFAQGCEVVVAKEEKK